MLSVDDHDVNRRVLHEQLTAWGLRSDTLSCGEAALQALRARYETHDPYAVVILDHHMPGMDGAALASAIRVDPKLRDTILIVLSSAGHANALRTEHSRSDIALVKPVRHSHLLNALLTTWARKNPAATNASLLAAKTSRLAGSQGACAYFIAAVAAKMYYTLLLRSSETRSAVVASRRRSA